MQVNATGGGKSYVLKAKSEAERDTWVAILQSVIAQLQIADGITA